VRVVSHQIEAISTHRKIGHSASITTLGLAAMATHTGVDYSIQPRGFQGSAPKDID
jgi:hypothetical protein